jgi:hypothetical protein
MPAAPENRERAAALNRNAGAEPTLSSSELKSSLSYASKNFSA